MDFRAAKIILAAFLCIAFVTPFFRLSVAMPKKGKNESVTHVKVVGASLPTQTWSRDSALVGASLPRQTWSRDSLSGRRVVSASLPSQTWSRDSLSGRLVLSALQSDETNSVFRLEWNTSQSEDCTGFITSIKFAQVSRQRNSGSTSALEDLR